MLGNSSQTMSQLWCILRELSIGTSVMVKNFMSNAKWLPGVVIDCVTSLTYSVQLHDGRIWKRHSDHIMLADDATGVLQTKGTPIQQDKCCEVWSYGVGSTGDSAFTDNQATLHQNNENVHCYPTRNCQPPQRLTDL